MSHPAPAMTGQEPSGKVRRGGAAPAARREPVCGAQNRCPARVACEHLESTRGSRPERRAPEDHGRAPASGRHDVRPPPSTRALRSDRKPESRRAVRRGEPVPRRRPAGSCRRTATRAAAVPAGGRAGARAASRLRRRQHGGTRGCSGADRSGASRSPSRPWSTRSASASSVPPASPSRIPTATRRSGSCDSARARCRATPARSPDVRFSCSGSRPGADGSSRLRVVVADLVRGESAAGHDPRSMTSPPRAAPPGSEPDVDIVAARVARRPRPARGADGVRSSPGAPRTR